MKTISRSEQRRINAQQGRPVNYGLEPTPARYIDANEVLRMMQHSKEDKPSWGDWEIAHDCCIDCVNGATTADVAEVKHGKWKRARYTEASLYICSECDKPEYKEHRYCPSCGAKMDRKDD